MKPITLEWIDKAEDDYVVAEREFRARKNPVYDAACFHAQQCAEKYLKARLVEADGLATNEHEGIRKGEIINQPRYVEAEVKI